MEEESKHEEDLTEGSLRERWREIRAALDDRVLRACLPDDVKAVTLGGDQLFVSVDSEFKKEYCQRKLNKLEEAVGEVLGPHEVVIGEPPLVEQAREEHPQRGGTARILVMGVGDGGVNAVARMREERLQGVRFVAVDTDRQVLEASAVQEQLQLGVDLTGGRGTGGDVEKGRKLKKGEGTGTTIRFLPDLEIFTETQGSSSTTSSPPFGGPPS